MMHDFPLDHGTIGWVTEVAEVVAVAEACKQLLAKESFNGYLGSCPEILF